MERNQKNWKVEILDVHFLLEWHFDTEILEESGENLEGVKFMA